MADRRSSGCSDFESAAAVAATAAPPPQILCSSSSPSSPSCLTPSSGYDTDDSLNLKDDPRYCVKKNLAKTAFRYSASNLVNGGVDANADVVDQGFHEGSANSNNNNNNNDVDEAVENENANNDGSSGKSSRCEMKDDQEILLSLPKLGRKPQIHIITIFAKGDDKKHLLDCPGLVKIHDLNPRENLIEQWNRLSLPPQGPDLILSKLHKALGLRDIKPCAAALMKNYESLRQHHRGIFQRVELVPLDSEIILTNRFAMQDLIDKVCHAVNVTLSSYTEASLPSSNTKCSCVCESLGKRQVAKNAKETMAEILSASRSITGNTGISGIEVTGASETAVDANGASGTEVNGASNEQLGMSQRAFNGKRPTCSKPMSVRYQVPASSSSSSSNSSSSPSSASSARFSGVSLPPFPVVVKSSTTSTKSMAMVMDEQALKHFASGVIGGKIVIEQFVQHDNAILKMYVIGREIFVVRRRSLPNVTSFTEAAVKDFASRVDGEFVPLTESSVGGYVVYQSDMMPKNNQGVSLLEECSDLDVSVLRLLTQALSRELRVDLFGFDVLIETKTRNVFVVDVNVLPGFKGVPSSQRRLCSWLSFLASRRAFKEDCLSLLPQDLLRLSLSRNDEEPRVNLETLQVRQITRNRIFEVMFKERQDSPGARARHTLVKFRPVQTPRRFIEDKDHFVSNLARVLASKGLGPAFIKDVSAVYFDRRRHLGTVRDWIEGTPLHNILTRVESPASPGRSIFDDEDKLRLGAIFAGIGVILARFHLLGAAADDADFRREILDRHFPGHLSTPVSFRLLEQWRRDAVLPLLCSKSKFEAHPVWKNLFSDVLAVSRDLNDVIRAVIERVSTPEAARTVFGHFDVNTNNIIVCGNNNDVQVDSGVDSKRRLEIFLIDEEWAAPNVAIYDFAKFVTSVEMMITRKSTKLTEAELRRGVGIMVSKYLTEMERRSGGKEEGGMDPGKVESFVNDVWNFVPLAALTNCFSNLVHASKEKQVCAEIPKSDELFQADGCFNWLRHARDHLSVFHKHFRRGL